MGGINHFIAVIDGENGQTSPASNVIVVEYDPALTNPALAFDPTNADITLAEGETGTVPFTATTNDGSTLATPIAISIAGINQDPINWVSTDGSANQNEIETLTVNATGLQPGTYTAIVTASGVAGYDDATMTITLQVIDPSGNPSALVKVSPNSGLFASTFGNNSFQIINDGDVDITNVAIDSSTTYMMDVVFDPVGEAGDNGAKCLTTGNGGNTAAEVGITVPANGGSDAADCESVFQNPHDGTSSEEGYDILSLNFTDFNPTEQYNFGVDMDPTSIKGDLTTGDSGAISGFELIGATVTIEFANGDIITSNLFDEGSLGGSQAVVAPDAPAPPPTIDVQGVNAPAVVGELSQTINVTGPADSNITLLQVDTRLHIDPGQPTVGYDIDPFEANEAVAKSIYTATLDANGNASIPVTLLETAGSGGQPDGGINHFIAVVEGVGDQNSQTSNVIVLEYDPSAVNTPPVADAGPDQLVVDVDGDGIETVVLDGSASMDTNNDELTYVWSVAGITIPNTATPSVDFQVGTYEITLTVTDEDGATDTDTVSITVEANALPVADAGADQTVMAANTNNAAQVTLDGTGSTDTDGTIVSYAWSANGGEFATEATPTYVFGVGTTEVTLTVTDDDGATATDTVSITVTPFVAENQPPMADAGRRPDGGRHRQ